jgi:hypothetical protein
MMTLSNRFVADTILSQTTSGLAGEYIAAASVLARGWRVAMAQQDAVDLVAWHPETGQMMRVQVKACQASRQGDGHRRRVNFQTGLGGKKRLPTIADYDILAMVSTEQRVVWYLPVTSINIKKYQKPISFFETPNLESDSWASAVEIIDETNPKSQAMHNNKRGSRNGSNR